MSDRGLIQRAHDRLSEFEYDAVPDDGRGSANDFRVHKATELLGDWLELHPEAPKWSWEQRLNVMGMRGGWLKTTVPPAGDDVIRWWPGPLYFGLPRWMRRVVIREIKADPQVTHVPLILRIGKSLVGNDRGFVEIQKFNATENVSRSHRLLSELVDETGVHPIIFGCDGDTSINAGLSPQRMMNDLAAFVDTVGPDLVSSICPGIEMNEWGDRSRWTELFRWWRQASVLADVIPAWSHFQPELYYNVPGAAGNLWQDKDWNGERYEGPGDERPPSHRETYLLDDTPPEERDPPRPYMDDKGNTSSPARAARRDGQAFVYFEYGVLQPVDQQFAKDCAVYAGRALRQLGMPVRIG